MTFPLCKDCRHFTDANEADHAVCLRYNDLVHGSPLECVLARLHGPCGRGGDGFEAKDVPA